MLKYTYYSNNYRGILMIKSYVIIATMLCLSGIFVFGGQEFKVKRSVARIAEQHRLALIQEQKERMSNRYIPTLTTDFKRKQFWKNNFWGPVSKG